MKKPHKAWDFLVLWPVIYIILFFVLAFGTALFFSLNPEGLDGLPVWFAVFFPLVALLHVASIIIILMDYIYAIHQLYTGTTLSDEDKRIWLILIVLFSFVTIPILHFKYLKKA